MKKLCADFLLKRHEKFPRLLSIELTTACNSSCIMCPRPRMKRRIAHMEDTGIGISLADLKKISAGLHNSVEGAAQAAAGISGLGLKVANDLLILHDGHLNISSEKGKGTRVFFELPLLTSARPGLGER